MPFLPSGPKELIIRLGFYLYIYLNFLMFSNDLLFLTRHWLLCCLLLCFLKFSLHLSDHYFRFEFFPESSLFWISPVSFTSLSSLDTVVIPGSLATWWWSYLFVFGGFGAIIFSTSFVVSFFMCFCFHFLIAILLLLLLGFKEIQNFCHWFCLPGSPLSLPGFDDIKHVPESHPHDKMAAVI